MLFARDGRTGRALLLWPLQPVPVDLPGHVAGLYRHFANQAGARLRECFVTFTVLVADLRERYIGVTYLASIPLTGEGSAALSREPHPRVIVHVDGYKKQVFLALLRYPFSEVGRC